jgi:hypothetical protein
MKLAAVFAAFSAASVAAFTPSKISVKRVSIRQINPIYVNNYWNL